MARCPARPRCLRNIPESGPSGDRESDFAVSTELDTAPTPSSRAVQHDWRLPYTILLTSLTGLFTVQVTSIVKEVALSHPFQLAGTLAAAAVAFALLLRNCSPAAERWPGWATGAVGVTQGIVTYLPLLAFGVIWPGMTSFLVGSVLLLGPGWRV